MFAVETGQKPDMGYSGRFRTVAAAVVVALLASFASAAFPAEPVKADRIVVLKGQRVLLLLSEGVVLKSYPIALGPHALGPKRRRGDRRTPEGLYLIDGRLD